MVEEVDNFILLGVMSLIRLVSRLALVFSGLHIILIGFCLALAHMFEILFNFTFLLLQCI